MSKDSIFDRVIDEREIYRAKSWVNSQAILSKCQNMTRSQFLTNSILLAKPSFELDILIFRAKLVFAK